MDENQIPEAVHPRKRRLFPIFVIAFFLILILIFVSLIFAPSGKRNQFSINISFEDPTFLEGFNFTYGFSFFNSSFSCPAFEINKSSSGFGFNLLEDEFVRRNPADSSKREYAIAPWIIAESNRETYLSNWTATLSSKSYLTDETYTQLPKLNSNLNYSFGLFFYDRNSARFYLESNNLIGEIAAYPEPPRDRVFHCVLIRPPIKTQDFQLQRCPSKQNIYYNFGEYCLFEQPKECNTSSLVKYVARGEIRGNKISCNIPLSTIDKSLVHLFRFSSSKEVGDNLVETISTKGNFWIWPAKGNPLIKKQE